MLPALEELEIQVSIHNQRPVTDFLLHKQGKETLRKKLQGKTYEILALGTWDLLWPDTPPKEDPRQDVYCLWAFVNDRIQTDLNTFAAANKPSAIN